MQKKFLKEFEVSVVGSVVCAAKPVRLFCVCYADTGGGYSLNVPESVNMNN